MPTHAEEYDAPLVGLTLGTTHCAVADV